MNHVLRVRARHADLDRYRGGRKNLEQIFVGPIIADEHHEVVVPGLDQVLADAPLGDSKRPDFDDLVPAQNLNINIRGKADKIVHELCRKRFAVFGVGSPVVPNDRIVLFLDERSGQPVRI